MPRTPLPRRGSLLALALLTTGSLGTATGQPTPPTPAAPITPTAPAKPAPPPSALPSEIPATFTSPTDAFDHERRDVMIPMRDGVKLHTVILVPKGAKRAPILLTRTPGNNEEL